MFPSEDPYHWAVANNSNVFATAEWKNLRLHFTSNHAVRWLQRVNRMNGLQSLHLAHRVIRNADESDLTCRFSSTSVDQPSSISSSGSGQCI